MTIKDITSGLRSLLLLTLSLTLMLPSADTAAAAPTAQSSKGKKSSKGVSKSTSGKSGKKSKGSSSKGGAKSKSSGKKKSKSGSNNGQSNAPRTSAEAKRRQENAQREVARTKEEIRENEANIKRNLSELSKIESDIAVSSREVGALRKKVSGLESRISVLTKQIEENNAELEKMRAEYLKAVKKMRGNRKRNSQLAFLFSSKNLSQAERRMRYLKEFSDWRERQTADINKTVEALRKENEQLARAKSDYDVMLGRQVTVQNRLEGQQRAQNAIVANLKANGAALNSHLAKKQAEVNALRNAVSSLIAQEQARAEAERRRKEAAEAEARAREERQREEAELRARQEQEAKEKALEQQQSASKDKKNEKKKEDKKADKKGLKPERKPETKPQERKDREQSASKSSGKDYASARKRKPRGGSAGSSSSSASKGTSAPKPAAGSNFAAMKGSLPRPVSGNFRITSPFGRHSLPDLPDVVYDNPGIDAEVSPGAAAKAVFAGKVSGVYMIPGFSTVVIVNHGDYYTVYGNIASSAVKVGQAVRQGDTVGHVASDPDNPGVGTIHFEVWKNREKLNPAAWIR